MMRYFVFKSPLGDICISERDGKILSIEFSRCVKSPSLPSSLLREVALQLDEYFEGSRRTFDFPVLLEGTPFQLEVWKVTRNIPYGKTKTYGEIAKLVGRKKAYRAVGNALNANKLVLFIPCHRVVAKNGIGGFGAEMWRKKWLLELEKNVEEEEKWW